MSTGWRLELYLCSPSPALGLRVVAYLVIRPGGKKNVVGKGGGASGGVANTKHLKSLSPERRRRRKRRRRRRRRLKPFWSETVTLWRIGSGWVGYQRSWRVCHIVTTCESLSGIPWDFFFFVMIFVGICTLEISGKERLFRGSTREIRNFFVENNYIKIIFRK